MALNKKWSYGSFKRKTYTDLPAEDFDGEIIGAGAVLFIGGKMTTDGLRNAISSIKK